MKKISFLLGLVLFSAFVFAGYSTSARVTTIEERFSPDKKKEAGTTGA